MSYETKGQRYDVERDEKWREWIKKIPAIQFKPEWRVKVIPPFGGAMARFLVEHNGLTTSVYLDVYETLGCHERPYWEVYPVGDDTGRVAMEDVDGLVRLIEESFDPVTD